MTIASQPATESEPIRPITVTHLGHQQVPAPLVRLSTCGLLTIERLEEVVSTDPPLARYQVVSADSLHGRGATPALTLLKLLVSRPERFASRDWLMEQFNRGRDELFSNVRLDNIASLLRGLLCPPAYKTLRTQLVALLHTASESGAGYQLAPYPLIWVDHEALTWHVAQAARLERFGDDPLPFWERAYEIAQRGEYLPDEAYSDWAQQRREEVAGMLRQSVQALARLYLSHHGQAGEEEGLLILRAYWQEHPDEEDILRPLMELLGQRECFQEALQYYERCCIILQEEGRQPDPRTVDIAEYLQTKQIQRPSLQQAQTHVVEAGKTQFPPVGSPYLLQLVEEKERNLMQLRQRTIVDWEETPSHKPFYGREQEKKELFSLIQDHHCHILALYGMGGIGKTSLAEQVVKTAKETFDYVFWQSLQQGPPLSEVLKNIMWPSLQGETVVPETTEEMLVLFMHYLRKYRCLLVLDNYETVLHAGTYRADTKDYGTLIHYLSEIPHQSCVLLTSREKPQDIARSEGVSAPVRSVRLTGVDLKAGRAILQEKGVVGSDAHCQQLIAYYSGNPLALKLIAEPIKEVFQADLASFLEEEQGVLCDIEDLLAQHFESLSEQERQVFYWFAIEREALSFEALKEDTLSFLTKTELLAALTSLQRRALLEKEPPSHFVLQPVILEYTTNIFVKRLCSEIESGVPSLLNSHTLLKAQSPDYRREAQKRFLLAAIADHFGYAHRLIEQQAKRMLIRFQQEANHRPGYLAGNLLNLLLFLHVDLTGYDFSHLPILQASLQEAHLPRVNFANSFFLKTSFTDNFGSILSVAFHPHLPLLAAGTTKNDVRIWNVDGTPHATFQGHTAWVRSVAFHPQGQFLASAGDDHSIRLWDVTTGNCKVLLGHTAWVRSITFHPQGQWLASAGEDQTIRLWDLSSGRCITTLSGIQGRIRSLAFCPDRDILASAGEDHVISLWDFKSGTCQMTLQGHAARVRTVVFHPQGTILASGGDDQSIRVWDTRTGKCVQFLHGHTDCIKSLAYHPNGTFLASSSDDQTIRLWEPTHGHCLKVLQGHTNWVWSVAFQAAGDLLASGGEDQAIRLWNAQTGSCLRTVHGYANWAWSIQFNKEGTHLIGGCEDKAIRIWDAQGNHCIRTLHNHTSRVRSVTFTMTNESFASSSEDRTIRFWSAQSYQSTAVIRDAHYRIWSLAFHPDSHLLAGGGEDVAVHLWETNTGCTLQKLHGHTDRIRSVAFSAQGDLLASGSEDETIRIWKTSSRVCLSTLHGHHGRVWSVGFHPHLPLLASGGDDALLYFWDSENGELLRTLSGHTARIRSVLFSPDGQMCASGSEDDTIRLWKSSTGDCFALLQGHTGRIRSLAFHPHEPLLVSSSEDGTLKWWHTQTYQCIKTLNMEKPYAGMNITNAGGLTEVQKRTLHTLGAFEEEK